MHTWRSTGFRSWIGLRIVPSRGISGHSRPKGVTTALATLRALPTDVAGATVPLLAFLGMRLDVSLDLDVRCTGCGAARDIPGKAVRVLDVDGVIYAEFEEPCACGCARMRLKVHSHGSGEAAPHEDGPARRRT